MLGLVVSIYELTKKYIKGLINLISQKTDNVVFEKSYKGEPSGIEATEAELWCHIFYSDLNNEWVYNFQRVDDKMEEAMKLLKEKGYKIIKD